MSRSRKRFVGPIGIACLFAAACGRAASSSPAADTVGTRASHAGAPGLYAEIAGCYFVRATENVAPSEVNDLVAMAPIVADSAETTTARGTVHRLAWHRDPADRRVGSWTASESGGRMVWSMSTGLGGVAFSGARTDSTFTAEEYSAGDIAPNSEHMGTITFVRRPCPRAIDVSTIRWELAAPAV